MGMAVCNIENEPVPSTGACWRRRNMPSAKRVWPSGKLNLTCCT